MTVRNDVEAGKAAIERAAALGLAIPPRCASGVAVAYAAIEEHRRRMVAP